MNIKNQLIEISDISGVSGYESKVSQYIYNKFKEYGLGTFIDDFGNVIALFEGTGENRKKILIDAHIDTIGLMVKSIDENGFIGFVNIGGVDTRIIPAMEVTIHGKQDIYGVVGALPPHLQQPDEDKSILKIDELYIDIGFGCEKANELVTIGDIITFNSKAALLGNDFLSAKALDNRAGAVALMLIIEKLKQENVNDDIYFLASVQEETGFLGAKTGAYKIEPDIAIIIDVTHGATPDAQQDKTFDCGKGSAICISPSLNKLLTKRLIDTAKKGKLNYQLEVEPGSSGTNAWGMQILRGGIACVVVSIPLKYMHTTVETLSVFDVENASELIYSFICAIGREELICF